MVEFDSAGFSAIGDFFGVPREDDTQASKPSSSLTKEEVNQTRGKRLGVGSKGPSGLDLRDDLSKQIMRVGRKRARDGDAEDDIDQDNDTSDDNSVAGRTGISSKSQSYAQEESEQVLLSETFEPKKKLGKKERQKAKETVEAKATKSEEAKKEESRISETKIDPSEPSQSVASKKKRRKIRSRQKNIRKDNRQMKPKSLVPGTRDYQGRPLTPETRSILNLPPPKIRRQQFSSKVPHESTEDEDGLAIDNLLVEDTGLSMEKEEVESKAKKRKSGKKKSKYKNL